MNEKKRNYRPLALFLSVVLLACGVVGGTYAWLIDQTDTVQNTFTYGDINIDLEETDTGDGDNDPNTNDYKMIPGSTITKDPIITVEAGSENCWLFVELVKQGEVEIAGKTYGFDDYLSFLIANGWTQLYDDEFENEEDEVNGVYFRYVEQPTDDVEFHVLNNDEIHVLESVNKKMLNALDKDSEGNELTDKVYPKLFVTAYAVQHSGFEAGPNDGTAKDEAIKANTAALRAWEAVVTEKNQSTP